MANRFHISDTHFGHKGILTFESVKPYRPFDDIEEHNEHLVQNWNSVVRDHDIVYHHGDFAFSSQFQFLARLRGKIILIGGNHDYPQKHQMIVDYCDGGRVKYCGCVEKGEVILTHIPVHPQQLESRFKYNIHGHLHTYNIDDPRYLNVSCEQINLTPISYEEVKSIMRKRGVL